MLILINKKWRLLMLTAKKKQTLITTVNVMMMIKCSLCDKFPKVGKARTMCHQLQRTTAAAGATAAAIKTTRAVEESTVPCEEGANGMSEMLNAIKDQNDRIFTHCSADLLYPIVERFKKSETVYPHFSRINKTKKGPQNAGNRI